MPTALQASQLPSTEMRGATLTDTQLLLELVGEVYAYEDLGQYRSGVLDSLRLLVPYDAASYNEITRDEAYGVVVPEVDPELAPVFSALSHENPLIERFRRTGDGRPYRISDVMDQDSFRGLALYRRFYSLIGVERQVAFTLPSSPTLLVGLALCREREDFTDREVQLLALARPHLIQAYRHAQLSGARAAVLAALEEGLDTIGRHVIVLDPDGRVEFASEQTRQLLGEMLMTRLPGEVRGWLQGGAPSRAVSEPLWLDGAEGQVLVRALPSSRDDRRRVLLCEPADGGLSAGVLRALGLTARQAETLSWLARGLTPTQAAERMGIAPRTLDKHLQHVYTALGVSDRAQAVATAWAAVGTDQGT